MKQSHRSRAGKLLEVIMQQLLEATYRHAARVLAQFLRYAQRKGCVQLIKRAEEMLAAAHKLCHNIPAQVHRVRSKFYRAAEKINLEFMHWCYCIEFNKVHLKF